MPHLSDAEIASIQADFRDTVLSDTCTVTRRASSGAQGSLQDSGYIEVVGTFQCYLTARIRQPDPDPENRSYVTSSRVNTEDERHLWVEVAYAPRRADKVTVASTGYSYIVTNFVDDYTPMPGVMCAVQKMK